jgi:hypothetical protein
MTIESAESSKPKRGTAGGLVEGIFRLSAVICAALNKPIKYFLSVRDFTPDGKPIEGRAERTAAVALGTEKTAGNPATDNSFIVSIPADAKSGPVGSIALDQDEIQRRRNVVRMLFNDYWNGTYEKPAAFVERLDQAEDYLNERLAASGEIWQLDAKTRVMLGLPPTKSDANPPRP